MLRVVLVLILFATSTSGDASAFIAAIEKEAESVLSSDQKTALSQDVILTQSEAGYVRVAGGPKADSSVVFKRKSGDEGKAVVVLGEDEDHLVKTEEKRTFVVLRQTFDNPKNYWVLYAYVRDAPSDTTGVVDIAGSKKYIEFDNWDHRGHPGNEAVTFGWSLCHSSPFIPCRSDDSAAENSNNILDEIKTTETEEADYPEEFVAAPVSALPKFAAVTSSGFSVAPNYALFADLEDDVLQAMFFGKTIRATAIGESVLEAAKPTLHALFKKLAPAVDPMVGADVPIVPASGTVDIPAAVNKAKGVSITLSQVTQEFLKQLGTIGLLSDPIIATNKTLTPEIGRLLGTLILKGLLNMKPNLGAGGKLVHPNPALMVDNDVLTQLVGGGGGPLQTAIQLQGPEAVAVQNLFQKPAGLSAIFDEGAVNDIGAALIPVLTGAVKSLPNLPALPVLNNVLPLDKITRLDLVKDELSNSLTGIGEAGKNAATKMATGTMEEKMAAAKEGLTGTVGALTKSLGKIVTMELKGVTGGVTNATAALLTGDGVSAITAGLGLMNPNGAGAGGGGLLGGLTGTIGGLGLLGGGGKDGGGGGLLGLGGSSGLLSSSGALGSILGGLGKPVAAVTKVASTATSAAGGAAKNVASSATGMFGSMMGGAKSGGGNSAAPAKSAKKFGFFRRSVEDVNYGFSPDSIFDHKRSVRKVVDDIMIMDLSGGDDNNGNMPSFGGLPPLLRRKRRDIGDAAVPDAKPSPSFLPEVESSDHAPFRRDDAAAPLAGEAGKANILGDALGGLLTGLGSAASGIASDPNNPVGAAGAAGSGVLGGLGTGVQGTLGGLGETVEGVAGGLQSTVGGVQAGVGNLATGLATGVGGGLGQIGQGDLVGGVGSILGGTVAGVGGAGVGIGSGLYNLGTGVGSGLLSTGSGLGSGVTGALGSLASGVTGNKGGLLKGLLGSLGRRKKRDVDNPDYLNDDMNNDKRAIPFPLLFPDNLDESSLVRITMNVRENVDTNFPEILEHLLGQSIDMFNRKRRSSEEVTSSTTEQPGDEDQGTSTTAATATKKPKHGTTTAAPGVTVAPKTGGHAGPGLLGAVGGLLGRRRRSPDEEATTTSTVAPVESTTAATVEETTTVTSAPPAGEATTTAAPPAAEEVVTIATTPTPTLSATTVKPKESSEEEAEESLKPKASKGTKKPKKLKKKKEHVDHAEHKGKGEGKHSLLGGLGGLLGRRRRQLGPPPPPDKESEEDAGPPASGGAAPAIPGGKNPLGSLLGGLLGRRKRQIGDPPPPDKESEEDAGPPTGGVAPGGKNPLGGLLGGLSGLLGRRRRQIGDPPPPDKESEEDAGPPPTGAMPGGGKNPLGGLLGGLSGLLGRRKRQIGDPPPPDKESEEDAGPPPGGAAPGGKNPLGGLLGGLGGLLGRKRRSFSPMGYAREVEEMTDLEEEDREERQDETTPAPGGGGLLGGLLGGGGGLGGLLGGGGGGLLGGLGLGSVLGGGGGEGGDAAGGVLGGLTSGMGTGGVKLGLHGVTGGVGGLLSGVTGGKIGAQADDGSFSSMAKDAVATTLADKILGEGNSGATNLGATLGGGLGGKLDSVLPTGGLFGSVLGGLGSAGDSTFGRMGKAAAGNIAREGMKGAIKGAINSGVINTGLRRRKRAAAPAPKVTSKTNADLFTILGWIGLDGKDDAAHASDSSQLFIGYGPCPKIDGAAYSKLDGLDGDDVVNFYLSLMRVQCLDSKVKEVKELISKKYVEIGKDKYFTVPSGLDVLKKRKLTIEESTLLSRALELASFSQVIAGQLKKDPATLPQELKDTVALTLNSTNPTILTMMRFSLRYLTQSKSLASPHFIKLGRHMVRTLKSALTKITQDYAIASFSAKYTPEEKQEAFSNVFHLTGLIHFYVNGLSPIQAGEDVIATLDAFLKANDKEIYKRALLYCAFDV